MSDLENELVLKKALSLKDSGNAKYKNKLYKEAKSDYVEAVMHLETIT